MGTHFRFGTGTAGGVDGEGQFHERVPAVPEGVVLTCLDPRELERSRTDVRQRLRPTPQAVELAAGWPSVRFVEIAWERFPNVGKSVVSPFSFTGQSARRST